MPSTWIGLFFLLAAFRGVAPSSNTTLAEVLVPVEHDSRMVSATLAAGEACAALDSCQDCTNTYTCHWCAFDGECHARGSIHGCSWGASCTKPKPKENTTCASHTTCSECSLSSHVCHWCEFDNACHAIGSRFGCAVGVDCYSNDRCRRQDPEEFHRFVFTEIPTNRLYLILGVGGILLLVLTGCHSCLWNVKGAYDDLATITLAAASQPPSVIGGTLMLGPTEQPFYQTLDTHPEEDEGDEIPESAGGADEEEATGTEENDSTPPNPTNDNDYESNPQQQYQESSGDHYVLMDNTGDPNTNEMSRRNIETTPFLTPSTGHSFRGIPDMEEPPHMARLYCLCSVFYFLTVTLVLSLVGLSIFFYPKPPVYNVCSDAVAWKKIVENMVEMKLDASFEILISVENANHLSVTLEKAKGAFSFDGEPVGTYTIPPAVVEGMAITDLMIIARVQPSRLQALQMAELYYRGKLVLEAEFKADLSVPVLFDLTYHVDMKDIMINVNEQSDRSLCHCPSWDEAKNHSVSLF